MMDYTYATVGDIGNVLLLTNALVFAYMAATRIADESDAFFDAAWKEEGFCVQHRDVPYWSSHDVCLYVDAVATWFLLVTYVALKESNLAAANDLFMKNIPGVLFHGIAHGAIGKTIREHTYNIEDSHKIPIELYRQEGSMSTVFLTMVLPFLLFWFALMKGSLPTFANKTVAMAATIAFAGGSFIPTIFGFTYVQTVLIAAFSFSQLATPKSEKNNLANASLPFLAGIPTGLVPWMESTQCSNFVRDKLYGHVVFDASIPICLILWYVAVLYGHNKGRKVKAD